MGRPEGRIGRGCRRFRDDLEVGRALRIVEHRREDDDPCPALVAVRTDRLDVERPTLVLVVPCDQAVDDAPGTDQVADLRRERSHPPLAARHA